MKQTIITTILVLAIIGLLSVIVLGSRNKKTAPTPFQNSQENSSVTTPAINGNSPIFFYGNTCPHCKDVAEWMEENKC